MPELHSALPVGCGGSDNAPWSANNKDTDMAKSGAQHLASLQDGRAVYLHGEQVADVTTHTAYRNSVASAAYLYDFQNEPDNVEKLTFESPT